MNTIGFEKKNVKMVAHRGVSGLEKENTCAAFVAAGNRTYWGIETDIHPNPDGCFAVIHDEDTQRVMGEHHLVEKEPMASLRKIILPDVDGSTVRRDLRIPSLEEYLSVCKKYGKAAVTEIKGDFTPEQLEAMLETVKKSGWLENTVFISFGLENLRYLRTVDRELPLQFLCTEVDEERITCLQGLHMDLDVYYQALTKEKVAACHAAGIKVNCWTVNDPAEARELAQWGVDYITSNILE